LEELNLRAKVQKTKVRIHRCREAVANATYHSYYSLVDHLTLLFSLSGMICLRFNTFFSPCTVPITSIFPLVAQGQNRKMCKFCVYRDSDLIVSYGKTTGLQVQRFNKLYS
jgi:hypothetical protein